MQAFRRFRALCAPLLLCALPLTAAAQDAATPSAMFLRELMGGCAGIVNTLIADAELGAMLKDRPNLATDICLCTSASVAKDQRLRERLDQIPKDADIEVALQGVQSYVIMRMMSSLLQCTSAEFESVLANASLDATTGGKPAAATPASP
jgi:hypothetical protein